MQTPSLKTKREENLRGRFLNQLTLVKFGSESAKTLSRSYPGSVFAPFDLGASSVVSAGEHYELAHLSPRLITGSHRHPTRSRLYPRCLFVGPTVETKQPYPPSSVTRPDKACKGHMSHKRKNPQGREAMRVFRAIKLIEVCGKSPVDKAGLVEPILSFLDGFIKPESSNKFKFADNSKNSFSVNVKNKLREGESWAS